MKKTVIIYGTSTGTCEDLAGRIGAKLGVDNIINVTDLDDSVIADNDNLILGTSTWGAGEVQDDWYDGLKTLKGANLEGKTVAIFGCGDSESYPDTFVGGMAEIYNAAKNAGANVIGAVPTDGYTFDEVAEHFGMTEAACRKKIERIKKKAVDAAVKKGLIKR